MNNPTLVCLWIADGEWEVRVDSPHSPSGLQHVHIRRRRKRRGEYSWNVDGTRHDNHKFPASEKDINRAKAIAAECLRVDPAILRFISITSAPCVITVTREDNVDVAASLELQVRSGSVLLVEVNEWLTLVELPEERA
jgi:hypothetical protein